MGLSNQAPAFDYRTVRAEAGTPPEGIAPARRRTILVDRAARAGHEGARPARPVGHSQSRRGEAGPRQLERIDQPVEQLPAGKA